MAVEAPAGLPCLACGALGWVWPCSECGVAPTLTQQLNAGHDANGNPLRLWALYDPKSGDMLAVVDEGFEGKRCIESLVGSAYRDIVELPSWGITEEEYRSALHEFGR